MKHIKTIIYWKDIPNYEGKYQVNQLGQVKSLKRQGVKEDHLLAQRPTKNGYTMVNLSGKNYLTHRLVAQAFIPNPDNLPEVDHINSIRDDNRLSNLQWISHADNNRKKEGGVGICKRVRCIETNKIYESCAAAAREMNVSRTAIAAAIKKKSKSAGYHWEEI